MIWEIGWSLMECSASKSSAGIAAWIAAAAQSWRRTRQMDEEVEHSILQCSGHLPQYFALLRRQSKAWDCQKGWAGTLRCAVERNNAAGLKQTTGLSMARGYWVLLEGTSNWGFNILGINCEIFFFQICFPVKSISRIEILRWDIYFQVWQFMNRSLLRKDLWFLFLRITW